MYSFKTIVVALTMLLAVDASTHSVDRAAHRRHHARAPRVHRRTTCAKRTVSSASLSVSASSSSSSFAPYETPSVTNAASSSVASSSSGEISSSSKRASSSKESGETDSGSSQTKSESSTKSSSSAGSQSTGKPAVSPVGNKLLASLFPIGTSNSWSTSPSAPGALPLSDATLKPFSVLGGLTHNYVQHEGKTAMQAHYPKGSFNFQHTPKGGISFYSAGNSAVDVTTAKELTFGYSVFFPEGFQFNKGGKLPGMYAGNDAKQAESCSGGRRDDKCMSARLMWRTNGAGELYTYLPPSFKANDNVCNVKPKSECNPTFGASVGRGAFTFETGKWTTISQRLKLNDAGQENGEMELFVNGESKINVGGLVLRNSDEGKWRGIIMQTFFGGSDASWASPVDQDVFFSDFSLAVTQKL